MNRFVRCLVFTFLYLFVSLAARSQEVAPFAVRPSSDIEPLTPTPAIVPEQPAPEQPPPPEPVQTPMVPKEVGISEGLIKILPEEEQAACTDARAWQIAGTLGAKVPDDKVTAISDCTAKIQEHLARLDVTLQKLGVTNEAGEKIDSPSNLWKDIKSRRDVPLASAAIIFDVDQCKDVTATTGKAADKCAAILRKEVSSAMEEVEQHHELVMMSPMESPIPPSQIPPTSSSTTTTGSTPGTFPRSWESIVIDALANQMVVQLQGVAAQKLLGIFGDALCKRHGNVEVQTYFPDTCNLLLPSGANTSIRLQMTQLPGEFQRTLRNDLVALLPATLQMARFNDSTVLYFVPLFQKIQANKTDPIAAVAGYRCPLTPSNQVPDEQRLCATLTLLGAAAQHRQDCKNDRDPRTCWINTMTTDAALASWATLYNVPNIAGKLPPYLDEFEKTWTAYNGTDQKPKRDVLQTAQFVVKAWHQALENLGPGLSIDDRHLDDRASHVALVGTFDRTLTRYGSVARTVYRIADGFRKGYDPLTLSISAATQTECVDETDLGCSVKFVGIAITTFREVAKKHPDLLDSTKDQTDEVNRVVEELITSTESNPQLASGTLKTLWDTRIKSQFRSIAAEAAPPLIDIHRGVEQAKALTADAKLTPKERDEELTKLYTEMIDSTFDVWRVTAGYTVPQEYRQRVQRVVSNARTCWRAARERNYLTLAGTMYSLGVDLGIGKPLPESAEQYRLLLTNLAAANDQQEFRTAIDTYLSQASTSITKFDHPASITLTGLPGLSMARVGSTSTEPTIFAPVGVDFFANMATKLRWLPVRLGVFVSLLDLGNLVSARYQEDNSVAGQSDSIETSTSFRDVFAPGVFVRFPIRQSGFSIGVGTSRLPVVRTQSGNGDEKQYKTKTSLFLAYDLSWFTFWRRR